MPSVFIRSYRFGGRGGNRTLTSVSSQDFESSASTNSATRPGLVFFGRLTANDCTILEKIRRA